MKRFLLILISLFLMGPCFAFNCGDNFGKDDGSAQYVRNEYKYFVECRVFPKLSKAQFGDSVDEDLRVIQGELEMRKYNFPVSEYDSKVDYILQLRIMNTLGSIAKNVDDMYSIFLSQDNGYYDDIEEEYAQLLTDTMVVKNKSRYKEFIIATIKYLTPYLKSDYRVTDLTAHYLKIMNTSNKSGMKGQLTDLYNQVIQYNKGIKQARYK